MHRQMVAMVVKTMALFHQIQPVHPWLARCNENSPKVFSITVSVDNTQPYGSNPLRFPFDRTVLIYFIQFICSENHHKR